MKITIELDVTPTQEAQIRQNSIERVLNNAVRIGSKAERVLKGADSEDASTLWQDAEDLKYITSHLWNSAREAIFKAKEEEEAKNGHK